MENSEDLLAQFGLDAIDLRWTLKDIAAKRSWIINEAQSRARTRSGIVDVKKLRRLVELGLKVRK